MRKLNWKSHQTHVGRGSDHCIKLQLRIVSEEFYIIFYIIFTLKMHNILLASQEKVHRQTVTQPGWGEVHKG